MTLDAQLDAPKHDYDVLMIAPVASEAFLDADPLVHQVNRSRRLKFKYSTGSASADSALSLKPVW